MLIERKNVVAGDIVIFKLVSGDEIIGKLVGWNTETGTLTINKPIVVAMQMVGPQQAQLGFMPFMAASKDDFSLVFASHSYLAHPVLAREDVAKGYINATSSIAVPTAQQAGLILGS